MRFICAQPTNNYFIWQVEVMIHNFIKMGINPNQIDILCGMEGDLTRWGNMAHHYNTVRFFFYPDTRLNKSYVSSIRPHILKKHFEAHPELSQETIFYHDCDILFTKPINEWLFDRDDNICYGSDTGNYIGADYIISRGEIFLDEMCKIVGIDKELVKSNEKNSIGAQYVLKGIDYKFWERVEKDGEQLFNDIVPLAISMIPKLAQEYAAKGETRLPNYNDVFQIWCADMWALLWNLWKDGKQTKCDSALNFAWASWKYSDVANANIYHNAGVPQWEAENKFFKGHYTQIVPYKENLNVSPESASYYYWQQVQECAKNTILL